MSKKIEMLDKIKIFGHNKKGTKVAIAFEPKENMATQRKIL